MTAAGRPWVTYTANDPDSYVVLRCNKHAYVYRVAGPMPAAAAIATWRALTDAMDAARA